MYRCLYIGIYVCKIIYILFLSVHLYVYIYVCLYVIYIYIAKKINQLASVTTTDDPGTTIQSQRPAMRAAEC